MARLTDVRAPIDRFLAAFAGELELTALSLHAYAHLSDKYILCTCGASMGDNYGPMVVARQPTTIESLRGRTIAVPGTLTTAFLTLRMCLGSDFKHVVVPFDEILDVVVAGQYAGQPIDAGLISIEEALARSLFQKEIREHFIRSA